MVVAVAGGGWWVVGKAFVTKCPGVVGKAFATKCLGMVVPPYIAVARFGRTIFHMKLLSSGGSSE